MKKATTEFFSKTDGQSESLASPYYIALQTASEGGAGTDFDVLAIIHSENGQSPEPGYAWILDNRGDDREKGQRDTYEIPGVYAGIPKRITLIWGPSSNSVDDWKLAWISIRDNVSNYSAGCTVNKWLRAAPDRQFQQFNLVALVEQDTLLEAQSATSDKTSRGIAKKVDIELKETPSDSARSYGCR